ncbi:MAG TPA: hypothetical protein VMF53_17365 [Alphaproteobacteria bacterium]|nr:hypothetical protein [Alphaproteobacteria bacterium]
MSDSTVLMFDDSDNVSDPASDPQAMEFLQGLAISRDRDGFSIRSKVGCAVDRLPTRIKIRAAYAMSRVSNLEILRRYRPSDFRFYEEAISTEVIGARIDGDTRSKRRLVAMV